MNEKLKKFPNLEFYVNVILSKEYAEKQALDEMRKEGAVILEDIANNKTN